MSTHCIIILSGPSAVGKTTISEKLLTKKSFGKIITCTSRAPRKNEDNYIFLNKKEFEQKIRQGDFIEYSEVYNNYYGILKNEFQKTYSEYLYSLVILDTVGSKKIMNYCKTNNIAYKSIFLKQNKEELKNRLFNRTKQENSSLEDTKKRLLAMKLEFESAKIFDKQIYNYDLQTCVIEIEKFIYEVL